MKIGCGQQEQTKKTHKNKSQRLRIQQLQSHNSQKLKMERRQTRIEQRKITQTSSNALIPTDANTNTKQGQFGKTWIGYVQTQVEQGKTQPNLVRSLPIKR